MVNDKWFFRCINHLHVLLFCFRCYKNVFFVVVDSKTHIFNIVQVHEILEHVFVLMSNLTKRTRCRFLEFLMNQLEFCVYLLAEVTHK